VFVNRTLTMDASTYPIDPASDFEGTVGSYTSFNVIYGNSSCSNAAMIATVNVFGNWIDNGPSNVSLSTSVKGQSFVAEFSFSYSLNTPFVTFSPPKCWVTGFVHEGRKPRQHYVALVSCIFFPLLAALSLLRLGSGPRTARLV
jgi:hypothetical protein